MNTGHIYFTHAKTCERRLAVSMLGIGNPALPLSPLAASVSSFSAASRRAFQVKYVETYHPGPRACPAASEHPEGPPNPASMACVRQ